MKICNVCGENNLDENMYCVKCGQPLNTAQAPTPTAPVSPVPEQPYAQPNQYNQQPYPQPPVQNPYTYPQPPVDMYANPEQRNWTIMQNIREIASSPLMLALIIIGFAQALITVLSGFIGTAVTSSFVNNSEVSEIISAYTTYFAGASSIFSAIPIALITIGLFMIYSSAKKTPEPMSTSGFTVIRVLTIIQLVISCIALAAGLVISVVMIGGGSMFDDLLSSFSSFSEYSDYNISDIISIVGAVIFAVVVIAGALIITWFTLLLKMLSSMIQTIRTGYPQAKFAAAVSVIAIILGVFAAFGIFSSLASIATSPTLGLVSFLSSATEASFYIILGILISKYKSTIQITY